MCVCVCVHVCVCVCVCAHAGVRGGRGTALKQSPESTFMRSFKIKKREKKREKRYFSHCSVLFHAHIFNGCFVNSYRQSATVNLRQRITLTVL